MKGYIFRCNDKTVGEVFSRSLLGEELAVWGSMENITEEDVLFLYNMTTFQVTGPLKPTSRCEKKLVADAWKAKFPVQVRFTETDETKTFSFTKIQHIFKRFRNNIYPWPELTEEQVKQILEQIN